MLKSSIFLILVILPIAFTSDRLAKLESTDSGKTVLNTLMIQTKLHGVNADTIRNVLQTTQNSNNNAYESYQTQAQAEREACQNDARTLRASLANTVEKRFNLEKTVESTNLYKQREAEYAAGLQNEVNGYNAFLRDIEAGQNAWNTFYTSMGNSITTAQQNLAKIRALVERSNPHNAASFAETESKESIVSEIKSNLEFRFYDTLGMKPILTGLIETAAKGISAEQFYKISHTMDLVDNFLVDRRNNLIEDNEYENTLNTSLTNSINQSINSINSILEITNGLVNSLDTRIGLLNTAVENAIQLSTYARNVMEARASICVDFSRAYFNHVRRYENVRLTIAELSNTFDEEYKDFEAFLQKKMSQQ